MSRLNCFRLGATWIRARLVAAGFPQVGKRLYESVSAGGFLQAENLYNRMQLFLAYLDPSSGNLLVQAAFWLMALFAAGFFKLRSFFFKPDKPPEE